ncbi:MAG: hypothetical protein MUE96_09965 [Bacteroidia bacterium]|jgi:hypothetical protein|nr:hypothetical protein [Bacteroidia bacterium]
MKNNLFLYLYILSATLLFSSCDNEVDINAKWDEIPVVYALMDASLDTQYFRIQKVYQNDVNTSVSEAAQQFDSIYFDTNMVVEVLSSANERFRCDTVSAAKSIGFFASKGHFLYRCIFKPNAAFTYRLVLTSRKTGKVYGSEPQRPILGSSNVEASPILVRPYNIQNLIRHRFQPNTAVTAYDILLRFYYKEYPTSNPADVKQKYVDYPYEYAWLVNTNQAKTSTVTSNAWIGYLKTQLTFAPNTTREFDTLAYVVVGASRELYNAYQTSIPSTSIVQKRTDYSNISGALGIFSSKFEQIRFAELRNTTPGMRDSSVIYLVQDLPNFIY